MCIRDRYECSIPGKGVLHSSPHRVSAQESLRRTWYRVSGTPEYGTTWLTETVEETKSNPYTSAPMAVSQSLYEGYIVSAHRMVMESRPVDPGSIQGSHRPISLIRTKHGIRANDFCETKY